MATAQVEDLLSRFAAELPQSRGSLRKTKSPICRGGCSRLKITREQIFHQLQYQELPYAITVETEKWEQFDNGDVKIDQIIHLEREAHKGIVLGKGGSKLKQIGYEARKELEKNLHQQSALEIIRAHF